MKQRLSSWQRMLAGLAGACVAAAIFLPIWLIDLDAPQYPEGLVMKIYANRLGGDVEIVNGLNHYIGMRHLNAADFPEFTFLPYVLGFFALLFLVTAVAGRVRMLWLSLAAYVVFAVLAMYDFWKWEYEYGHNLDPNAPIQVPGMSYQPPLIGFKQLLNFGAYSIPDIGGWLMALAGVLLLVVAFFTFRKGQLRREEQSHAARAAVPALAALLAGTAIFLSSCKAGPTPIQVGKDNCDFCRMGIADARFGAEVMNKKGKAWKFDDPHCLLGFLKEGSLKADDIRDVYFTRFDGDHALLASGKALLLQSEALHSPMGGNVAAFAERADLDRAMQQFGGQEISWETLRQQ